jgi:hypothetical protein
MVPHWGLQDVQEVVRSPKHLETHFETDSTHGIMAWFFFSVFFMPDILSMEDISWWKTFWRSQPQRVVGTFTVSLQSFSESSPRWWRWRPVSLAVSKPCVLSRGPAVLCNEAALPSKGFGDGSAHNEEAQLYSPQPTHDDWLCRYMSEHLEVKVVRWCTLLVVWWLGPLATSAYRETVNLIKRILFLLALVTVA